MLLLDILHYLLLELDGLLGEFSAREKRYVFQCFRVVQNVPQLLDQLLLLAFQLLVIRVVFQALLHSLQHLAYFLLFHKLNA